MRPPGNAMKHNKASATRVFYRNRFSNGGLWLLCTWTAIVFLQMAVENIETDKQTRVTGTTGHILAIGLSFALMIAFLIPALRFPLHGVVVMPTKIIVRNIMRTHVLSWSEVERFELAKYDPWPRIGVAVLKSSRRVPMVGVQWAPLSRFAEKTVSALNEQLAAAQDARDSLPNLSSADQTQSTSVTGSSP
jgi:hypothetical protein